MLTKEERAELRLVMNEWMADGSARIHREPSNGRPIQLPQIVALLDDLDEMERIIEETAAEVDGVTRRSPHRPMVHQDLPHFVHAHVLRARHADEAERERDALLTARVQTVEVRPGDTLVVKLRNLHQALAERDRMRHVVEALRRDLAARVGLPEERVAFLDAESDLAVVRVVPDPA